MEILDMGRTVPSKILKEKFNSFRIINKTLEIGSQIENKTVMQENTILLKVQRNKNLENAKCLP